MEEAAMTCTHFLLPLLEPGRVGHTTLIVSLPTLPTPPFHTPKTQAAAKSCPFPAPTSRKRNTKNFLKR